MFAIARASSKPVPRRRAGLLGRFGMAVCGVCVCLGSGWLGVQASEFFGQAAQARARNDSQERTLLKMRLQNQRAEKEIKGLESRAGLIMAARKQGWTFPNERPLRIPAN